jgi:hypothetical protein
LNLEESQEVVSVSELFIVGNEISQCPNQMIESLEERNSSAIGYGAICLPDVSGLVIRDNQILNTGASLSDPVCGIFLLHGEQVEISRNQILDERVATVDTTKSISGLRAGISIVMVTPPASLQAVASSLAPAKDSLNSFASNLNAQSAYQANVPALCIHDNVVNVPVGLALSVAGLGAFSIKGNHFATGDSARSGTAVVAAGVMVLNFGTPLESASRVTTAAEFLLALESLSEGANAFAAAQIGTAASSLVGTLGPGPVLFSDNRCSIQLLQGDDRSLQAITSVWISTFDDLGFHDNQCFLQSSARQVACDVFLLGLTLRAMGNRFQEKREFVSFSNLAYGVLNISSLNIATNPMWAIGPTLMNTGNLIL